MYDEKPLHHQFEDDLGRLVDDYLERGIIIDALKKVLRYEANHDHQERRKYLGADGPDWFEDKTISELP